MQRQTERKKTMLDRLKAVNVARISDPEEILELLAIAHAVQAEYVKHEQFLEQPDWLYQTEKKLSAELKSRLEDKMAARLARLNEQAEALMSREEKRKKIEEERAALVGKMHA